MKEMRITTILLLLATAVVVLGGGAYYLSAQNNRSNGSSDSIDQQQSDSNTTEEIDEIPDKFVGNITIEQARVTAQNRRPGKTIKKIEREVEEGVGVYSVRFTDSGRVDVNAVTGDIMKVEAGDGE